MPEGAGRKLAGAVRGRWRPERACRRPGAAYKISQAFQGLDHVINSYLIKIDLALAASDGEERGKQIAKKRIGDGNHVANVFRHKSRGPRSALDCGRAAASLALRGEQKFLKDESKLQMRKRQLRGRTPKSLRDQSGSCAAAVQRASPLSLNVRVPAPRYN